MFARELRRNGGTVFVEAEWSETVYRLDETGRIEEMPSRDGTAVAKRVCPKCGSYNTRFSQHGIFDVLMGLLKLQAFRCRRCGRRFRKRV